MNTELQTIGFAGAELQCAEKDGEVYVSLRRACEGLGIAYSAQLQKLRGRSWATVSLINTVAEDGAERELAMVDLDTLAMWLATIDARRVADEARPRVELYQQECVKVIRRHFFAPPAAPVAFPPVRRETQYPDGKVVIEYFTEQVAKALEATEVVVEDTDTPAELAALRRRFSDALVGELNELPHYKRMSKSERGEERRRLNRRLKTINNGRPRDQWRRQHYERAAEFLRFELGIDVRWALRSH